MIPRPPLNHDRSERVIGDTMSGATKTAVRVGAVVVMALTSLVSVTAAGAGATRVGAEAAPFVPAATAPRPMPASGAALNGAQSSLNWAGYAATGASFSSVSGSWRQPTASCPANKTQLAAFWVGLDGYASSDPSVQQIGTDSDCVKGKGKNGGGPSYYAWFEMYPAALVILPSSSYPVSPGDAITASVSVDGTGYLLVLVDAGRWTYASVQTPSIRPQNSSAEWIAEAPTSCKGSSCKILPLADFGSLVFTGAKANGQPISSASNSRITMANKSGKKVKAQTSALVSAGSAFSVSWQHV
jgi:hypothetical protein